MVLQETYEIYDVLKQYNAIADYYQSSTSDLALADGVFSKTTGNVIPLNPTTNTRFWTVPKTIEFDVVTVNNLILQVGESSNAFNTRLAYLGAVDGSHIRIVYDGTKITPYVDGVEKTSYIVEWSHTTGYYINFYNSGAWKNLIIY